MAHSKTKLSVKSRPNTPTQSVSRLLGILGALVLLIIFINKPSFPTPDKLLIFLTFVAMTFGQAKELLKRLGPFVGLLIVYESFRGLAHQLNDHVNYLWMPSVDRWLFGGLPTEQLQHVLWHGTVQWYDFVLYIVYMLHFVMPIGLAIIIWKKMDKAYWRYMFSYVALSFAGFVTYLLFPAAPPWMASGRGLIEPIERISTHVWFALGVHNFPSVYNKISPNPVAAVPSLHAAYAALFALFVYKLFGRRWGALAALYPLLMAFGVVYQGEHYFVDVLLGVVYAFAAYYGVNWLYDRRRKTKTVAVAK